MTMPAWGTLDPKRVSDWINFKGDDKSWIYQADDRDSMAAKQTEGVAYLWNLLAADGVALLADEVGMGKTFQALGVAALLWKMKPDARVLVMAPNRDLCLHWRREFEGFVRQHYREADHSVKNIVDGGPVPSVYPCYTLEKLEKAVARNAGHLYLTTIHALSGLVDKDRKSEGARVAGEVAGDYHRQLKRHLGEGGFDLIIVDEAHYLRNVHGGSQRVAAARALFGSGKSRLGAKTLLLTATPSHTRLVDVQNILGYFTELDPDGDLQSMAEVDRTRTLLEKHALRRLRLMEGQGGLFSKRHYRHEKAAPSGFEGRPDAEMFFALYQKRLVADLRKQSENKSLMYGYLEGFESFGWQPQSVASGDEDGEGVVDERGVEDFSRATDTELLRDLTRTYHEQFKAFPDHPKYGALIEQCVPEDLLGPVRPLEDHKHLVFVRRIPSVRELTQRVNERYDEMLAGMIVKAWGKNPGDRDVEQWRSQGWSRDGYQKLLNGLGYTGSEDEEDVNSDEEDEADSGYLASRIAELFVVKKGAGGQSDCANVRLRFTKPESLFSLFLEPASDYLEGGYSTCYAKGESRKADYANAARYVRFQAWENQPLRTAALAGRDEPTDRLDRPLHGVWTLLVQRLPKALRCKLERWAGSNKPAAENFANYIKAGFLHASPVVVELYAWFVESQAAVRDRDVQRWYRRFYDWVSERIDGSLMLRYFIAALETFDQLCGKIIDHGLERWDQEWRSLKRLTSPCWYASGENSDGRQRLILGFNSPFYPNVLVSTSVFQEGVNLHLQCHQIHHYGLAGSPGDNEQRVGRLDRLFGCVNQRLMRGGEAELSIHYPFLKRSVDEDQVASFIERKHRVEEQMDACVQARFDKEVRISDACNWKDFLRKPLTEGHESVKDPYGASFSSLSQTAGYEPFAMHAESDIRTLLESFLNKVVDPAQESFRPVDAGQEASRTLFLVDPLVQRESGRRYQPIFVNLVFSAEFSALLPETVYLLSLTSPISSRVGLESFCRSRNGSLEGLEQIIRELSARYPMARLTINEEAGDSYFYLGAVIDLPLFVGQGRLSLLSSHEFEMAYRDLKHFADELETGLYGDAQDLTHSDLAAGASVTPGKQETAARRNVAAKPLWQDVSGEHGNVARLTRDLSPRALERAARAMELSGAVSTPVLRSLALNQRFPFVCFLEEGGTSRLQLNYPKDDLQQPERELLERWFLHVLSIFEEAR